MNKYSALVVFVLVAAIALTACGSSGTTLNATLSDAGIAPTAFTAPAGAHVTFVVTNDRTDVRDCIFFDVKTMKLYPGQSTWALNDIAAGTTKTLAFDAPAQAASYQIQCGGTGYSGNPRQPAAGLTASLDVK